MLAAYSLLIHNTIITEMNEAQKEKTHRFLHLCILRNKRIKEKKSNLQEGNNVLSVLSHRITAWVDVIWFRPIHSSLINNISDLFFWLYVIIVAV